ncbi:MAG: hypothetical protein AAGI30_00765 [Planctomycetota bacterium]
MFIARCGTRLVRIASRLIPLTLGTCVLAPTPTITAQADGAAVDAPFTLPRIYRLDVESSYRSTSVACDIPDVFSEALRGTLSLRREPLTEADLVETPSLLARFRVDEVNLLLDANFAGDRITGTGVYEVHSAVNFLTVLGERLALDTRFAGEHVSFDSGVVPADGSPRSFDLTLAEQTDVTFPCVRRELRLAGSLTPARALIPYILGDAAAYTTQPTPLGPVSFFPLNGRFLLTPLPVDPAISTVNTPSRREWAAVAIDWSWFDTRVLAPFPVGNDVAGSGIYQQWPGENSTDGATQRFVAELTQTPFPLGPAVLPTPQGFDSGRVQGPAPSNLPPFLNLSIIDTNPDFPIEGFNVVAGPRRWFWPVPHDACLGNDPFEVLTYIHGIESDEASTNMDTNTTTDAFDLSTMLDDMALGGC